MGENTESAPKPGPALQDTVHEVQGHFPGDAAMQDALARLALAGYDRADFSLPEDRRGMSPATPDEGAENPTDEIDQAQVRTMGTSMAGYAGAVAVAGAMIATGGAAALAAAAAAAVGAGAAVAANAAGQAADRLSVDERDQQGAAGTLILAVRTRSAAQAQEVMGLMRETGATSAEPVTRSSEALTAGVSSASWTGA